MRRWANVPSHPSPIGPREGGTISRAATGVGGAGAAGSATGVARTPAERRDPRLPMSRRECSRETTLEITAPPAVGRSAR